MVRVSVVVLTKKAVTCHGWLEKKRQKRYFVLRDNILWWFIEEPSNLYTDFTSSSKCRGSIQIEGLSLINNEAKTGFELVATENNPSLGVLKPTKDSTDLAKWERALSEAIAGKEAEKLKSQGLYKSGWMEKMGQKRFFVLRGSNLSWYIQPRDGAPQGVLDIAQCEYTPTKAGFMVTGSYIDKKYELKCEPDETVEWLKAINNAKRVSKQLEDQEVLAKSRLFTNQTVTFSGFLEKNGTQRFFILNGKVLTWYLKNPAVVEQEKQKEETIKGSLSLDGAHIIYTSGFSFTIQPLTGKVYTLKASTVPDATSWVRTLKLAVMSRMDESAEIMPLLIEKGWVKKKYTGSAKEHDRYLVLTDTLLAYYDTDKIEDGNVTAKGTIELLGSQTVHTSGSLFCVKSASGRLYPWQASDAETAEKWVTSINRKRHMLERDTNALPKVDETKWGKLYLEVIKCTNIASEMEGSVILKTELDQVTTPRSPNCAWDENFLFEVEDLKGGVEVIVQQHSFFSGNVPYGVTFIPFLDSRDVKIGSSNVLYKPGSEKKEKGVGEIEIRSQFVCYAPVVLALKDKHAHVLKALAKTVTQDSVASAVMYYAWLNGFHNQVMELVIKDEVKETQSEQQLFRLDSKATKLLIAFMRRLGKDWLSHLFLPLIDLVSKSPDFEIDPAKMDDCKADEKEERQLNAQSMLRQLTTQFLEEILTKAIQTCPKDILNLCSVIYREVLTKFPDSAQKAVGGIIFLRFLCPAITTPPASVIKESDLSPGLRRKLLFIAKIIQNIANDVEFGKKEPYMLPFNPMITEYKPMYQAFLKNLSLEHPTKDLKPVKLSFTLDIKEHRENLDTIIAHWAKVHNDVVTIYEEYKKPTGTGAQASQHQPTGEELTNLVSETTSEESLSLSERSGASPRISSSSVSPRAGTVSPKKGKLVSPNSSVIRPKSPSLTLGQSTAKATESQDEKSRRSSAGKDNPANINSTINGGNSNLSLNTSAVNPSPPTNISPTSPVNRNATVMSFWPGNNIDMKLLGRTIQLLNELNNKKKEKKDEEEDKKKKEKKREKK